MYVRRWWSMINMRESFIHYRIFFESSWSPMLWRLGYQNITLELRNLLKRTELHNIYCEILISKKCKKCAGIYLAFFSILTVAPLFRCQPERRWAGKAVLRPQIFFDKNHLSIASRPWGTFLAGSELCPHTSTFLCLGSPSGTGRKGLGTIRWFSISQLF
jgi:hypothetical protein